MLKNNVLALVFLALPTAAGAQNLAGCWAGSVAEGGNQRRAALELARTGGTWRGAVHMLSRAVDTDSLVDLRIEGSAVRFRVLGTTDTTAFEGTVAEGALTGTLRRTGQQHPARFTRAGATADPASRLIGYWAGWFDQNGAQVLRAGLKFVPAPCGQVLVTLDSPDQGAENLPLTSFAMRGDSVLFEMTFIQGAFRGIATADSITGQWTQGPSTLGLKLGRTDSMPAVNRPQEPKPPFPYDAEEVEFENPNDGTRFAGTLTLPKGAGPFPAAVLLTGSGAQDRNEMIMAHKPFLVIADYLTRRGIAVLRFDDRGVGGSTGNVMEANLVDNAEDALAAIHLLQDHPRVDARRIGLIGHSEGGWMAPIAASRSSDVAYIVMLAGPAVSGEEILIAQSRAMQEASGASRAFLDANQAVQERLWPILRNEPDDSTARAKVMQLIETVQGDLPADQAAALDSAWGEAGAAEQFQRSLSTFMTRWFRYLLSYDPRPTLDGLTIPVLALFGELDLQVPPTQSVPILKRLWTDHPDATVHVFPKLNHLFQTAETGHISEYARIEETFAPDALKMMGDWITRRFVTR